MSNRKQTIQTYLLWVESVSCDECLGWMSLGKRRGGARRSDQSPLQSSCVPRVLKPVCFGRSPLGGAGEAKEEK